MWNSDNPTAIGKYLAVLFKSSTSQGSKHWFSVEEWEGKSWNNLGNVCTNVIAWQALPEPWSEENPGDWIDQVGINVDRNIPFEGEEVLVTIFNWETEETTVDITTYYDGRGFDCEDDFDLNVEAWKTLPIFVK